MLPFTRLKQDVTAAMNQSDNKWMAQAAMVSSVGFLVVVATLIGLGIGMWLDSKLGTKPWLAFVFTLVGLAAGIYEAARIILNAIRSQD
jgi:F0F1-type ATP synthase assembly protein I